MPARDGATILVAHSDRALEPVLKALIQELRPEARTDWVYTALDASHRLDQQRYHLLITDVFLGKEASGLDLWKRVDRGSHPTSVLFISQVPVETFLKKIQGSTPCPAYLSQPFRKGEFKQVIEGLLSYPDSNFEVAA
jgi:DNA-binding response OmpR family regulator